MQSYTEIQNGILKFLIGYKNGDNFCFGNDNQVFQPRDVLGLRKLTVIMQSVFELGLREIHQLLAGLPPTRLWWEKLTFTGQSIQEHSSHVIHLIYVQLLIKQKKM